MMKSTLLTIMTGVLMTTMAGSISAQEKAPTTHQCSGLVDVDCYTCEPAQGNSICGDGWIDVQCSVYTSVLGCICRPSQNAASEVWASQEKADPDLCNLVSIIRA